MFEKKPATTDVVVEVNAPVEIEQPESGKTVETEKSWEKTVETEKVDEKKSAR